MKKRITCLFLSLMLFLTVLPLQVQADFPDVLVGAEKQFDDNYGVIFVVYVPAGLFYYDFNGLVQTDLSWMVSTDMKGDHPIVSKRCEIDPGDNLFFITVFENNRTYNYTVIIRNAQAVDQETIQEEASVFGVEYSRLMTVFTWGNGTNVRKEPNTNSAILGKMNRGDSCTMIGFSEDTEWVKIVYNGEIGYIKKNLLILPVSVWLTVMQETIAYDGPGVNYVPTVLPANTVLEWYGSTTEDDGYYVCGLNQNLLYIPMVNEVSINPSPMYRMPFNPVRIMSRIFSVLTGSKD